MSDYQSDLQRSRQKVTLIILSGVLMVAGLVVLLLLKRMPLIVRAGIGFGDFVAASALMLFIRQNYAGRDR